jgi:hypothetical protein
LILPKIKTRQVLGFLISTEGRDRVELGQWSGAFLFQ